MKEVSGRPLKMCEALKMIFGEDKCFWLIPTKPKLVVNFLENVYTEEVIKRFEEDKEDYDVIFNESIYQEQL
jgi:hypothetical protein